MTAAARCTDYKFFTRVQRNLLNIAAAMNLLNLSPFLQHLAISMILCIYEYFKKYSSHAYSLRFLRARCKMFTKRWIILVELFPHPGKILPTKISPKKFIIQSTFFSRWKKKIFFSPFGISTLFFPLNVFSAPGFYLLWKFKSHVPSLSQRRKKKGGEKLHSELRGISV